MQLKLLTSQNLELRKFNPDDPDTLTGTTIDIAAVFAGDGTNIDLLFHLDVVHHYYGWCDGVTLTFPVGTRIVEVPPVVVGGSDGSEPVEIIGNVNVAKDPLFLNFG